MTTSDPQPATMIRLNKFVRCSPQRAFEALTRAEELPKWFVPGSGAVCENVVIEARVGGTFYFEMSAGPGKTITGNGIIQEFIENKKISYTWSWNEMPEMGAGSLVTFELFEAENPYDEDGTLGTEIVLTHERLHTAVERSEHTGGWWNCLRALGYYVRGVDPREAMYSQPAGQA